MRADRRRGPAAPLGRTYPRRVGGRIPDLPALILLTDERRLSDPAAAIARLPRGGAVILRHYGLANAERLALAHRLRRVARRRGVLFLVAVDGRDGEDGRALARAVGADGLHLSERRLRRDAARILRLCRPGWLVTTAAHSWPALRLAARRGLDAVLLSPVFATASHPGARGLGSLRFAAWVRASRIPVYALGGVDGRSAARLRASGACGLAAIGALAPPVDPAGRTV